MTPYVVRKDREGTVRIYHRKLGVAVAEFYHHSAGDALAIKDILDGKDGLLPAEPPQVKAKARGTLEEIQAYGAEIGLLQTDGQWFFDKCEGNGWKNGTHSIKDWRATMRSWKVARYFPSLKTSQSYAHGHSQNQPRANGGFNQPGRYTSQP